MAITRGALHMKKHDRRKRAESTGMERACMRCRRAFRSDGPHHRMCSLCRRQGDDGGADPSYVGPLVGVAANGRRGW